MNVYSQICSLFLSKIMPHVHKPHALSAAVKPNNAVDVNLKMFDILGRIAIHGIWLHSNLQSVEQKKESLEIVDFQNLLKSFILNNPILLIPYKEEQQIDLMLAIYFLSCAPENKDFIYSWLKNMLKTINFNLSSDKRFPCLIDDYSKLIEYPNIKDEDYRKEITAGSVLYPMLSVISAILDFDDCYEKIQLLKKEILNHSNFQLWYPDEDSEQCFYTNKNRNSHGATLSHVPIDQSPSDLLNVIFKENKANPHTKDMSAVKSGIYPLILVGCRHYRLPIPLHFFEVFTNKPRN